MTLREQLAGIYEHGRFLTLDRIQTTASAIAAWAGSRDLDTEWESENTNAPW